MDLTPEKKAYIDSLSHYDLLRRIRFSKVGDPMFQGETGKYWMKRYAEMRDKDYEQAVRDSKDMGWG